MKLSEIAENINSFTGEKLANYVENEIKAAIKKTINDDISYYYNKEYAKPFLNN